MQAPIRFGVFELDLDRIELRKAGTLLRMRPQPLKLLALLAAYAGELVTREKIRQELWSAETNADFEQGVNRCIKEVRSALDHDAESPRYIKTVHRRGYMHFLVPGFDQVARERARHARRCTEPLGRFYLRGRVLESDSPSRRSRGCGRRLANRFYRWRWRRDMVDEGRG